MFSTELINESESRLKDTQLRPMCEVCGRGAEGGGPAHVSNIKQTPGTSIVIERDFLSVFTDHVLDVTKSFERLTLFAKRESKYSKEFSTKTSRFVLFRVDFVF